MKEIEKNIVQFDYFSSNYNKFEEDFYKFSNINIPLTFLTDDILNLMWKTRRNYFRLNALNAKDNKDHYFIFRMCTQDDNKRVFRYEYEGHRYSI